MTMTVDISQLSSLSAQLAEFGRQVKEEVALEGVASMANVVYQEVRLNASRHVKSGLLLSAIYRAYSPERSGEAEQIYHVSWNKRKAPHGHLIEFGTSRAPAYPFLRPSLSAVPQAIDAGRSRMSTVLAGLRGAHDA